MNYAKEIAYDIGMNMYFLRRQTSRKGQFDEISNTEREPQTVEECFRTDYFLVVVDIALSELRSKFESIV